MNHHVGKVLPVVAISPQRIAPAAHVSPRFPRAQRGVALVVALILLIVITLVGLAAVGGTIMQNKMASNQRDREIAFQSAESALRVVQQRIVSNPSDIARNCQSGGTICLNNPFDDPNLPPNSIHTLPTAAYTVQSDATGQPQYVIENMGDWINFTSDTGYNRTANAAQYGSQGKSSTAMYYRITVRSGDPAKVGDRAVVTLQAVVRQG